MQVAKESNRSHTLLDITRVTCLSPVVTAGAGVDPLGGPRVSVDAAQQRGPAQVVSQAVWCHVNLTL